ncbi:manganese efflux pump MntP [Anaerosporobacter faecicola]|uniref:manganese efflux pump MntP n=1 Tax=Anaerosporobacter faecicola TaxID=2718714 RepID=UPI0014390877|nr:manganese efflux pump MntP family protein [Anaerosporobacter faecicola]
MSFFELFLLAVGLSMDAFAVSICEGLSMKKLDVKRAGILALAFGGFQAGMPLIGYLLGKNFQKYITSVDHWIAFVLLAIIGFNMIKEALEKEEEEKKEKKFGIKYVLVLAVATSIDALAVGITFAFLQVQIVSAILLIGVTTFVLSFIGVKIGNVFGVRYKAKAELLGGVILIVIGLKILLEHLGILG